MPIDHAILVRSAHDHDHMGIDESLLHASQSIGSRSRSASRARAQQVPSGPAMDMCVYILTSCNNIVLCVPSTGDRLIPPAIGYIQLPACSSSYGL